MSKNVESHWFRVQDLFSPTMCFGSLNTIYIVNVLLWSLCNIAIVSQTLTKSVQYTRSILPFDSPLDHSRLLYLQELSGQKLLNKRQRRLVDKHDTRPTAASDFLLSISIWRVDLGSACSPDVLLSRSTGNNWRPKHSWWSPAPPRPHTPAARHETRSDLCISIIISSMTRAGLMSDFNTFHFDQPIWIIKSQESIFQSVPFSVMNKTSLIIFWSSCNPIIAIFMLRYESLRPQIM